MDWSVIVDGYWIWIKKNSAWIISNAAIMAMIAGVVAFIGKNWAEKRLQKLKGFQTEQLENVKSALNNISSNLKYDLDRNALVFKTHFDLEFRNYVELWNACDEAYDAAASLHYRYQHRLKDPADTQMMKDVALKMYETCRKALISVRKQRPFIDQAICDVAISLVIDCVRETQKYHDYIDYVIDPFSSFDTKEIAIETQNAVIKVGEKYDALATAISDRIKHMYVDHRG